jgi:hypothetical protein
MISKNVIPFSCHSGNSEIIDEYTGNAKNAFENSRT